MRYVFGQTYKEYIRRHHCLAVPDEIINDWWDGLLEMKSYVRSFDRPETAVDRWGVTLIPPESIDVFIKIIITRTSAEWIKKCGEILFALLSLLEKAKEENKFVIHYGV